MHRPTTFCTTIFGGRSSSCDPSLCPSVNGLYSFCNVDSVPTSESSYLSGPNIVSLSSSAELESPKSFVARHLDLWAVAPAEVGDTGGE